MCVNKSMSVCAYAHVCSRVCMEASGREWVSFLVATHLSVWDRVSHWAWSLPTWGDCQVNKLQEASRLCFLSTGFADIPCYAQLVMDSGDPNAGPQCLCDKQFTYRAISPAPAVSLKALGISPVFQTIHLKIDSNSAVLWQDLFLSPNSGSSVCILLI